MSKFVSDTDKVDAQLKEWGVGLTEAADRDNDQGGESETYQVVWGAYWEREEYGPDFDPEDINADPQKTLHDYLAGVHMSELIDRHSGTYIKQVDVDDVGLFDKATHRRLD